jgi:hypothetical protein
MIAFSLSNVMVWTQGQRESLVGDGLPCLGVASYSEGLSGSLTDRTKDHGRQGRSPLANSRRTKLVVISSVTLNVSSASTVNIPDSTRRLALRVPSTNLPSISTKKQHVHSRSLLFTYWF